VRARLRECVGKRPYDRRAHGEVPSGVSHGDGRRARHRRGGRPLSHQPLAGGPLSIDVFIPRIEPVARAPLLRRGILPRGGGECREVTSAGQSPSAEQRPDRLVRGLRSVLAVLGEGFSGVRGRGYPGCGGQRRAPIRARRGSPALYRARSQSRAVLARGRLRCAGWKGPDVLAGSRPGRAGPRWPGSRRPWHRGLGPGHSGVADRGGATCAPWTRAGQHKSRHVVSPSGGSDADAEPLCRDEGSFRTEVVNGVDRPLFSNPPRQSCICVRGSRGVGAVDTATMACAAPSRPTSQSSVSRRATSLRFRGASGPALYRREGCCRAEVTSARNRPLPVNPPLLSRGGCGSVRKRRSGWVLP
jgi:hypothetical protein